MNEVAVDTRLKIIETARVLFADLGFEGTSVREIAKNANVNVASVNYHFSSKENLFGEIMQLCYNECSVAIHDIFKDEQKKLEDALVEVFQYFLSHSHDLLSYFKMMLSAQHSQFICSSEDHDGYFGPPGGQVISAVILKELKKEIAPEDLHWGLSTLFSHVVHISIIFNCCLRDNVQVEFSGLNDLEKGIRRLTKVVLSELASK